MFIIANIYIIISRHIRGYTSSVAFATASPQGEALVYGAASRESSSSMENDNVDWG